MNYSDPIKEVYTVDPAIIGLTAEELFRVNLALDFEVNRIKRLIKEEDTPGRRANLAATEKLFDRLKVIELTRWS